MRGEKKHTEVRDRNTSKWMYIYIKDQRNILETMSNDKIFNKVTLGIGDDFSKTKTSLNRYQKCII